MKIDYITLRLLRHFLPEVIARFLLNHRWIISPGLESSAPAAAADQYVKGLAKYGKQIIGKKVLILGYGGRFAVGVELLKMGVSHVVLCDHFVLLDKERNLELLPVYSDYLVVDNGDVRPKPEFITLLHGDIRDEGIQAQIEEVDYVLSTSVFEHLDDVNGITGAIAKLTESHGFQLHFVDLRDHYFKYPFEMLRFSEKVWKNFLNPTSNLNRFRLPDYRKAFEKYFDRVDIVITKRDEAEFQLAHNHIRPEFLTGDDSVDSVELIYIIAESPKGL